MSSVEWAGLSIVVALVYIVLQHIYVRRLTSVLAGLALGRLELEVDGENIHIRRTGR